MSGALSPEESLELGRRYYKLGQIEKALNVFNGAINTSPTLSLHDYRAACHDKLGDYDAAVRDGRAMIKLDKQDVRGYLRTASVLDKSGKPEIALGIYKYGMKHVPVSDKNFKLLQQLHDKLTRRLSPDKAVDPLTVLPVEIAELILEHLSFNQMIGCMRVSRGWIDYIQRLPRLWLHLDMSAAKRPVPRSFVDKAVRRSAYRLEKLTLHRFQHMDVVQNVAKACRNLAEINVLSLPQQTADSLVGMVQSSHNLQKLIIHPDVSTNTCTQILRYGAKLRHMEYRALQTYRHQADWHGPFPHLEYLQASTPMNPRTDQLSLDTLFASTPSLKTLILTDISVQNMPIHTLPLTTLTLKRIQLLSFPLLPATLQNLTLDLATSSSAHTWHETMRLSPTAHLTHLSLSGFSHLSAATFSNLLDLDAAADGTPRPQPGAKLQHVSLSGTLDPHTTGLFRADAVLATSPRILTRSLTHLGLYDVGVDDDEVEALVRCGLGLASVDLSGSKVTGASLKMLVDGVKGLEWVRVDGCAGIQGRDAISYAEGRGVRVFYRGGEVIRGRGRGRRVRE